MWNGTCLCAALSPSVWDRQPSDCRRFHDIEVKMSVQSATSSVTTISQEQHYMYNTTGSGGYIKGNQAYAGNFSKTLPHDPKTALVDPSVYQALLHALQTGTLASFDRILR